MQRGVIYPHRQYWCLRWWEAVPGATNKRRKMFKRLALISEHPKTRSRTNPVPPSVQLLAEQHLLQVNSGRLHPESAMSVMDFIEKVFLPWAEKELRPSTVKHYKKDIFNLHVKDRLGNIRLRDFRTVHGQRLLRAIPAGRRTLIHAKVFLSSVFKHARREGFLDSENPMRDTSVPGRPAKTKPKVYTMDEISHLILAVGSDGIADLCIGLAALTGLRMSEIRALRWSDFDGERLHVSRSMWRTSISGTKTAESEAAVPILPVLKKALDDHRAKTNGADHDFIFRGPRGKALNLANLTRRVILPAIAKYEDYPLKWKGWHGFRRSLATNLYSLGVAPKTISSILRHRDIATTLAFYTVTPDNETRNALQRIEDWFQAV